MPEQVVSSLKVRGVKKPVCMHTVETLKSAVNQYLLSAYSAGERTEMSAVKYDVFDDKNVWIERIDPIDDASKAIHARIVEDDEKFASDLHDFTKEVSCQISLIREVLLTRRQEREAQTQARGKK